MLAIQAARAGLGSSLQVLVESMRRILCYACPVKTAFEPTASDAATSTRGQCVGHATLTVVPCPLRDSTLKRPAVASARSLLRLVQGSLPALSTPLSCAGSSPMPSSPTLSSHMPAIVFQFKVTVLA